MSSIKKIKAALISVYDKEHLEPIIALLNQHKVTIYSTGGTETFIRSLGIEVTAVEYLTSFPSILGGRVKTLHPKIFGGILARRENKTDQEELKMYTIPEIDLVIVDLYPFEQTVASGASEQDIIEKIDIGGISLIRGAAKNYKDVTVVASKKDYGYLTEILNKNDGGSCIEERKELAKRAFNHSSHYDTAIFNYFNREKPIPLFKQSIQEATILRYGENPHQKGIFYGDLNAMFEKLNGKELSYNNLVDTDAAVELIKEFTDPTFAILKHTNACGVASRNNLVQAWKDTLACDPISAFGGIIITNSTINKDVAAEIHKLFFEVIIAPEYSEEALKILSEKKNRIILVQKSVKLSTKQFKTLLNGVVEQDKDLLTETQEQMKVATTKTPNESEFIDLEFANKIVKHTKSNTIVLAKGKQLMASGVGQTSRVDALKQAIHKATTMGFDLKGAVMASDAFFPFPDCVEIAHEAGITAVLQPGGSVKDQDSIDFCNDHNLAMVFTGTRHFKH